MSELSYKEKLLSKLEDLTNKIINEEPKPDSEFDTDLIDVIDDLIDEALSC